MLNLSVIVSGQTYEVELEAPYLNGAPITARVNGEQVVVIIPSANPVHNQIEWAIVNNHSYEFVIDRDLRWIRSFRGISRLELRDLQARVSRPTSGDGRVKAPIPGTVTRILVKPGEWVNTGQALMILEAMKMENQILSPRPGMVNEIYVSPGQAVSINKVLAEIA
jgi:biotin carboxyl carrier protein